ncbi:hypothetical protein ADM98_11680 [Exiguobacterium sp. BMC-KP]|uniref:tyrosine-type recombinase/integrase n=1 Tax=Exiguobacterium sp. BMC-KP TaxID=1684312 RepID=UPI0006AA1974|nr:tyrosine-type recombinase/integrase [Exiguobacterium sp. BMC-KP]KOP29520.1 hypothetical protein ADM98_11680 [Exiguobacterium sp. BMC-KP]
MNYKIIKLDNGKYWTRLSLTDRNGVRHQPSKTADTQREIKRWAQDMIRKNEDGLIGKKTGLDLEALTSEYLVEKQGILKEMTLYARRVSLGPFLRVFGSRKVSSLNKREITSWLDRHARERQLKANSRNSIARHINSLLSYSYEAGYHSDKELRIAMLRSPKERERVLWTIEHIKLFEELYWFEPRAKLYILLAHTGLRSNEARSLGWEHIDFKNGTIRVERQALMSAQAGIKRWTTLKSGNARVVPMSRHLRTFLERWRFEQMTWLNESGHENVQDLVFTSENGKYIYDKLTMPHFRLLAKSAGLPVITLHTLRHTYATLLIQQGLPLTGIQAILGHADLSTTVQTYLHVTDEMKDRARDLLDEMYEEKTV